MKELKMHTKTDDEKRLEQLEELRRQGLGTWDDAEEAQRIRRRMAIREMCKAGTPYKSTEKPPVAY